MNNCRTQLECLCCGGADLSLILDLRTQPLANAYKIKPNDFEVEFKLGVNLCVSCYHMQLTDIVSDQLIYKDYKYVSGTSDTLRSYSSWFSDHVAENISRKTNNILDIGCNDGSQLNQFKKHGFNTFGIDPAENIYPISSINHSIICAFFDSNILKDIHVSFDAIVAQNVFAHNHDPLSFLINCRSLMSDHTKLFVQTSQANMIKNKEFDTIYHEHVNFFNATSMNVLVNRAGLYITNVSKPDIHGTSYLFTISKVNDDQTVIRDAINKESELLNVVTYTNWANSILYNMKLLFELIVRLKKEGCIIVGYGAAAKGNTLLNFTKLPVDIIIDDNPLKHGLYTPGLSIPITAIEWLNTVSHWEQVVFVPLAWNFFDEIKKRIAVISPNFEYKFVKYFPEISIEYP